MLLELDAIDVRYGRIHALKAASLTVAPGEIVAVLGANGAGKSSLLRAALGLVRPRAGGVRFDGAEIGAWPTSARVRHGLVLVPEGRRILMSLSVEDNLLMGAYNRRDRVPIRTEIAALYELFPQLGQRRDLPAAVLSGGEQQMLAIGRALLARPKLMMLDEPSLGLSPKLVNELFELIARLNRDGLSMLLVEQNTHKALAHATRAYVLELGQVVMEGPPDRLLADPGLQQAYLGQADG
jgi:branched-chain amino acid transport system ATP-binding protein